MSSTRTQNQLCTTTSISSFVQSQVSFRLLPSSVATFILIEILYIYIHLLLYFFWLINKVYEKTIKLGLTDTHQYLHATSCHVYHSKKSIPYNQALRFNRIQFFDKMCNDLEVWLKNRGYNEKLVRQQILKARKYRSTERLYSQRAEVHENNLVFNITYYQIFSKFKNILFKIHLLLHRIGNTEKFLRMFQ